MSDNLVDDIPNSRILYTKFSHLTYSSNSDTRVSEFEGGRIIYTFTLGCQNRVSEFIYTRVSEFEGVRIIYTRVSEFKGVRTGCQNFDTLVYINLTSSNSDTLV